MDPYRQKQNQNASSALAATDYSDFAPLQKKSAVNVNDFAAQGDPRKLAKKETAPKYQAKKPHFAAQGQK